MSANYQSPGHMTNSPRDHMNMAGYQHSPVGTHSPLTPNYQSPGPVPNSPLTPSYQSQQQQSHSVPNSPRDPMDNNNHMSKATAGGGYHGILMPPPLGRRRMHSNQGYIGNNNVNNVNARNYHHQASPSPVYTHSGSPHPQSQNVFQYPDPPYNMRGNNFQNDNMQNYGQQMNDPNMSPHMLQDGNQFQFQAPIGQQCMNDPNPSPHGPHTPHTPHTPGGHASAPHTPHTPHTPINRMPVVQQQGMNDPNMSPHPTMSPHHTMAKDTTHFQFPVVRQQMNDPNKSPHMINQMNMRQVMNDPNKSPHVMVKQAEAFTFPPLSVSQSMNDPNSSPHPMNTHIAAFNKQLMATNFAHCNDQRGTEPRSPFDHRPDLPVNSLNVTGIQTSMTDDKGMGPLSVGVPVTYTDTGQPSPASSATSMTTQGLRFQSSGNAGDAMLSAINYNDSDLLQDSHFDVANNLNNISDNLLSNMNSSSNMSLGDGGPPTFDLFEGDGHVSEPYNPQELQLPGDAFGDSSSGFSMSDSMDADNPGNHGNPKQHNPLNAHNPHPGEQGSNGGGDPQLVPEKPRGKGRPSKSGGSPGRGGVHCQVCQKAFNNSSALAKHKLTHSDERKYVCPICSKAFKRQDHLNGHMMTHRSKKPYECKFEGCDKSYCDARSLRRHLENHHQASQDMITTSTVTAMTVIPPVAEQSGQFPSGRTGNTQGGQFFQFEQSQENSGSQWQQNLNVNRWQRPGDRSPGYLQQVSPISPAPGQGGVPTSPLQRQAAGVWGFPNPLNEPKPVECSMCHRRFKNIPALNGHMRLHGGYFKKVSDLEKDESKKDKEEGNSESQPPELTPQPPASSSGADSNSSNASLTEARNMSLAQHLQQPIQQQQQQQQQHQPIQQQQQHQQLQQPMGPPKLEPAISVKLESSLAVSSNQGQPTNFVSTSHMTAGQLSVKKVNVMPPPSSVHLPLSGGFSMSQSQSLNSDEGLLSSFAGVAVGRELGMEQTGVGVKPSSANTRIPSAFTFTDADSVKTKQKLLQALQEPSFRPIQQENLLRPMQEVNERKRHASADPDKFTSPTRKNSLTSPGSLAYMLTNFQKTGSTVKCELEKRRSQEFFDQDEMFVRPEPVRSRSRPDEHSIGRPRSRTDDPFHARKGIEEGMGVFRNPGAMHGSQIKAKRKHRPEPLVIPQNMSHFGFQSRLRSPRIWEPSGAEKKTGHTPPPYTPPPMLSPVRSGSGLFWSIQPHPLRPVTPKSAPVTPKIRRGSFGLSHSVGGVTSWSGLIQTKEPIKEEEDEEEEEEEEEEGTEVEEETQIEPPPETDIQPHVNIGPQYQADVPSCLESRNRIYFDDRVREDLVWDPAIIDHTTEDEVQSYQEFASCAAVPGNGVNMEYALHLLHIVKGDVQKAILELMKATPKLPNRHPLVTFSYQESDTWSSEEIEAFIEGMLKFDKDFFNVSKEVKTKTTKQCIQFYYLWKKVCLDEYKRMRILRRKRTDDDIYNLRSRAAQQDDLEHQQQTQADSDDSDDDSSATGNVEEPSEKEPDASNGVQIVYTCAYPNCNASFPSKQALSGHIRIHVNSSEGNTRKSAEPSPHRSPHRKEGTGPPSNKSTVSEGVEEFPCKICGKVFYKVKSRSAHMKSHSDKERNRKNALAAQNNSPYSPYSDT